MKSAYLSIPEIKGKILLSPVGINHIGKREIINCATVPIKPQEFSTLSSVRTDNQGEIIKEQFSIQYNSTKKQYYIEDRNSSNGTYLGNLNLKQTGIQLLNPGDKIIVPLERKGKLVQLEIIFQKEEKTPQQIQDKNLTISPEEGVEQPFLFDNKSEPPKHQKRAKAKQEVNISPSGGEYFDPTFTPTVGPDSEIQSMGYDFTDTSTSFIVVQEKVPIPKNCFDPKVAQDLGLDFSIVYKLEMKEIWHILIAFGLLFVMIYHTYVNFLGIFSLITYFQYGVGLPWRDVLITPLPTALVFCITFICHELGHLYTGKYFQYPSKFLLVKRGIKLTVLAALIGIPIGLPGAAVSVGVDPQHDKDKMGAIKMAGPAVNLIIGLITFIIAVVIPQTSPLLKTTFLQSAGINFMLGGFNLIPKEFHGFAMDGKYILGWRKKLYFTMLAAFLIGYAGVFVLTGSPEVS
ncbi:MAG: hypothetical protein DRO88_06520 [Promethearchaeia archaeon]|nr:MAG: hypothetical protein DRO88_06520 [Candidatus Lokiarchaeia archaeon]